MAESKPQKDTSFNVPKITLNNITDENENENGPNIKPINPPTASRQKPQERANSASRYSNNPYNNMLSYSHEATTVPPYVLDGISNSQADPNSKNSPDKSGRSTNTMQDPFLTSLNNDWGTFFETVDSTPAYSEGVLNRDVEALSGLPDLSGRWGGDARLKSYLNKEHTDLADYTKKYGINEVSSDSSSIATYHKDSTKSRSKAGYWMSTDRREEWRPYFTRILISNNYLPLFFRIWMIILSIVALAISGNIFRLSQKKVQMADSSGEEGLSQQPSTIMAICVQSVGLVYLCYITYDEFNSKPLGIRNPVEKMKLILLDLLFIIFSSANISLTFNTLYDKRWVCSLDEYSRYPKINSICENQKALSAFLFVILIMWVINFTISIMRVIQKVAPGS